MLFRGRCSSLGTLQRTIVKRAQGNPFRNLTNDGIIQRRLLVRHPGIFRVPQHLDQPARFGILQNHRNPVFTAFEQTFARGQIETRPGLLTPMTFETNLDERGLDRVIKQFMRLGRA